MRLPTAARVLLAVAVWSVAAVIAIGCLIALDFELDGFGRPRDTPVRAAYVLALSAGIVVSIIAAALTGVLVLPKGSRIWLLVPVVGIAIVAVLMLGVRALA